MRFITSCAILFFSFTLCAALLGCAGTETNAGNLPQPAATTANPVDDEDAQLKKPSGFDADRAFDHVRKQVEFGPRPSGSKANEQTRAYLQQQLQSYGLKVTVDEFVAHTPSPRYPTINMANVVGELPGTTDDVIIIASHFDTKLFDNLRFVGANDGGSSTACLLEIARVLGLKKNAADRKIPQTIWFAFFDGEEAVVNWFSNDHTYGSRHMVESLTAKGQKQKIKAMILLDMIGDRELAIPKEGQSSGWLVETIWNTGRKLGYEANFPLANHYVEDDHIEFLRAGIPACDLIDFNYGGPTNPYWHNDQDTADKLSPQSLKIVGDTILKSLPKISAQVH
ncbi:MAG: M28 family peptidase [Blastocatellia bacterium]|nr:M28 family peptidase [Blastocatellia bacterium]